MDAVRLPVAISRYDTGAWDGGGSTRRSGQRWRWAARRSRRAALLAILGYVVVQGVGAINWDFLTQLPHPIGVPGGGVGNGILGTLIIIGIATAMAVPIGLLTGIYLALFGRGAIPEALALSLRRAVRRAEHRDRPVRVRRPGRAAEALLGILRIVRVHDADAAAARAYVGAGDSFGAADGARRRARAWACRIFARRCGSCCRRRCPRSSRRCCWRSRA